LHFADNLLLIAREGLEIGVLKARGLALDAERQELIPTERQ